MKRDEESLMVPPLEDLQARIPQKYELVLAATRRAKQIIRQRQLNASTDDDTGGKPLTLALHDIAQGRVGVEQLSEPDIIFDDHEEEQQDFFPELERFHREDEPDDALDIADDDEDEEDLDLEDELDPEDPDPSLDL
jgi:DNA-directed RNA polymerase omega subunit